MSDIGKFLQKKQKVNMILRKESRNMSIECKTLFVSVWYEVMKLTAVGRYHFSSDIRNFKNIEFPSPHLLHTILRTSACVCRTSENCKSLVLQGECNIEIFLSPASLAYLFHTFLCNSQNSVKPENYSKDRKLVFKTIYRSMQIISIAECSKWSILQYFRPSLS